MILPLMVRLLCGQLVGDRNAHAAAGAGDHADGRLQVRRVQVGHFGAGDLLQLLLRNGRDLRLVGHAGTALDTDSLLDKDSRRGRLGDEAEGTVRIDRNDDRNQVTDILLRALVEFLRERHDVHAVLAKRRANRGSRGSFAGRNLEFDIPRYFLSHFVHLQKLW